MAQKTKTRTLVIFDGDPTHNWVKLFQNRKLSDGSDIRVIQCSWNDCKCVHYPDTGCLLTIAPVHDTKGKKKPETDTVKPDFILVRNQVRGPTPVTDNRNTFYGILVSNVPSINSLISLYLDLERAAMVAELKAIEKRVGHDKFPLVPISFYSNPEAIAIWDGNFPAIIKVSHAHAGKGKAKLQSTENLRDVGTILEINSDYCTVEPYITTAYGIRVQKIGDNYRVYKKVHTGSGWKSQFGGADLQTIPLTDTFKLWADECAKCYGGMDLLAVDAVCDMNGNFHILELNGSAIGIQPIHWEEDSARLVELTISRMELEFCAKKSAITTTTNNETAAQWNSREAEIKRYLAEIEELKENLSNISRSFNFLKWGAVPLGVLVVAVTLGIVVYSRKARE